MPTNIGSEALSALRIGESAVSKSYVGISQIFPNNTEITAAAFDDATIANTGGNTPYTVSGEIGATFTLTGSIDVTGTNVNVPGSGTAFLSELSIGDEVVISGETRTIAGITSDTAATVTAAFGSDLANDTSPDCNPTALVDVIIK